MQDGLALEAGRAADPVAFGQHADDFAVRMLADLAHQRLAVAVGHPVLRLDLAVGVDLRVKARLRFRVLQRDRFRGSFLSRLVRHIEGLGVHLIELL